MTFCLIIAVISGCGEKGEIKGDYEGYKVLVFLDDNKIHLDEKTDNPENPDALYVYCKGGEIITFTLHDAVRGDCQTVCLEGTYAFPGYHYQLGNHCGGEFDTHDIQEYMEKCFKLIMGAMAKYGLGGDNADYFED